MWLKACIAAAASATLLCGMVGCGGSATSSNRNRNTTTADNVPRISGGGSNTANARAAEKAKVEEVDYFGFKALRLTNGLVSVTAVPALGGRVMEYNLGDYPFLWIDEAEVTGTASEESGGAKAWRNYGGYKVWPAPQSQWGGPPDPEGSELDGGAWSGKIVTASGPTAVIELTSPEDARVTGLQIVRRLTLHAGTTRLDVQETFRNVCNRELSWSVWGVTQVPGFVKAGEGPSTEARVYFPADGEHPKGFFYISEDAGSQFQKVANGKIVQVSYGGEVAKIGSASAAGWVASVNESQHLALVQTFKATPGAEYPDQGSIVQVYTSPAESKYMEMEVNSPITKIAPGSETTFSQTWYCTSVSGPLVKVTEAGAINVHPTAARKGKQLIVTGGLGVFAPGEVSVVFLDAAGKKLDASRPLKATPAQRLKLHISAPVPDGAGSAMLILSDSKGAKIGNLAEIPLKSPTVAKAGLTKSG